MPFIETALIGDEKEENINHYGGVRLRITGSGFVNMTMYGLDKALSQELLPLSMSIVSGREPTRLSNFKNQRALLRMETTKVNEIMDVSRIIIFARPIYTSYPQ